MKKPVQDQNSPLTVPAVETEQPPPKPKKFFKSRNVESYSAVPQITYAPPVSAAALSPEHSFGKKESKGRRGRAYNRDSSSPETSRYRGADKTFKVKKSSLVTKASRKEETSDESQPPNKRYLVRNRNKVINYAEDGSNSPIPDILTNYVPSPIPPKISSPKISSPKLPSPKPPSPKPSSTVSSPSYIKPEITSPSANKDTSEERKPPPIVLRISKGTSRIVSTDSNEGFTSPGSDRHSSLDIHNEFSSDHKKSPSVDSICSPKHEGLKITIKCSSLNQESSKKERKKKEHKSHKKHHKNSDEEPLKKTGSPSLGTDHYDLYKTLVSPVHQGSDDKDSKIKHKSYDKIESELSKLDSQNQILKSPHFESQSTEIPPEPKPPEKAAGRSRRNRPNINYNENDDYFDTYTSGHTVKHTKTVCDTKKESRRSKRKHDVNSVESTLSEVSGVNDTESQAEQNELLDILSGNSDSGKSENDNHKTKGHKKHKHKHNKQINLENLGVENNESDEQDVPLSELREDVKHMEVDPDMTEPPETNDCMNQQQQQSADTSVYTNNQEFSEEEPLKPEQDNVFKSPHGIPEVESCIEDKPSVKLVITKKKGSIFKSKSLVNDNSTNSPLPARKRRHLYRHEWANDVSDTFFSHNCII